MNQSLFGAEPIAKADEPKKSDYVATTKNGHRTDEVASAMQKAIRRGDEKQVLYWVSELFDIGWWRYILKRMAVIASEDIGMANPDAIAFVSNMINICMFENGKDNRRPDSLHFWHLAIYLARSPKSRMVDYAGGWIIEGKAKGDVRYEVPDYARDQHTAEGKALGMGDKEFFEEGARIANKKKLEGEEFYTTECLRLYGQEGLERDESQF